MIGGFSIQPLPGFTQGQSLGQATLIAVNLAAMSTAPTTAVNISEGAGRINEVPVNYAFRMRPYEPLEPFNGILEPSLPV